uniref:Uncharacterized protein n=1 Tax=Chromera velia CCMP2878 TaxID=1169474 RepID=A0A0G4HIG4_9ALVE|eukprot:Cvel_27777.t1-p1 / transcript=Cvel_27777.t1 / gene=Cvel_27777 / organism=Chromera_velia_CCMP2878 / gene_product=hypothetical protein / transcript_product=hypothetical protein / location=Cvel_scaffold3523:2008-8072(+) / protein_length=1414 / sequence_SO=supercontig / SO=protein_coding / is_pseudo=false
MMDGKRSNAGGLGLQKIPEAERRNLLFGRCADFRPRSVIGKREKPFKLCSAAVVRHLVAHGRVRLLSTTWLKQQLRRIEEIRTEAKERLQMASLRRGGASRGLAEEAPEAKKEKEEGESSGQKKSVPSSPDKIETKENSSASGETNVEEDTEDAKVEDPKSNELPKIPSVEEILWTLTGSFKHGGDAWVSVSLFNGLSDREVRERIYIVPRDLEGFLNFGQRLRRDCGVYFPPLSLPDWPFSFRGIPSTPADALQRHVAFLEGRKGAEESDEDSIAIEEVIRSCPFPVDLAGLRDALLKGTVRLLKPAFLKEHFRKQKVWLGKETEKRLGLSPLLPTNLLPSDEKRPGPLPFGQWTATYDRLQMGRGPEMVGPRKGHDTASASSKSLLAAPPRGRIELPDDAFWPPHEFAEASDYALLSLVFSLDTHPSILPDLAPYLNEYWALFWPAFSLDYWTDLQREAESLEHGSPKNPNSNDPPKDLTPLRTELLKDLDAKAFPPQMVPFAATGDLQKATGVRFLRPRWILEKAWKGQEKRSASELLQAYWEGSWRPQRLPWRHEIPEAAFVPTPSTPTEFLDFNDPCGQKPLDYQTTDVLFVNTGSDLEQAKGATTAHPDPDCFVLATVVEAILAANEASSNANETQTPFVVFWDVVCLPPPPRTVAEQAMTKEALRLLHHPIHYPVDPSQHKEEQTGGGGRGLFEVTKSAVQTRTKTASFRFESEGVFLLETARQHIERARSGPVACFGLMRLVRLAGQAALFVKRRGGSKGRLATLQADLAASLEGLISDSRDPKKRVCSAHSQPFSACPISKSSGLGWKILESGLCGLPIPKPPAPFLDRLVDRMLRERSAEIRTSAAQEKGRGAKNRDETPSRCSSPAPSTAAGPRPQSVAATASTRPGTSAAVGRPSSRPGTSLSDYPADTKTQQQGAKSEAATEGKRGVAFLAELPTPVPTEAKAGGDVSGWDAAKTPGGGQGGKGANEDTEKGREGMWTIARSAGPCAFCNARVVGPWYGALGTKSQGGKGKAQQARLAYGYQSPEGEVRVCEGCAFSEGREEEVSGPGEKNLMNFKRGGVGVVASLRALRKGQDRRFESEVELFVLWMRDCNLPDPRRLGSSLSLEVPSRAFCRAAGVSVRVLKDPDAATRLGPPKPDEIEVSWELSKGDVARKTDWLGVFALPAGWQRLKDKFASLGRSGLSQLLKSKGTGTSLWKSTLGKSTLGLSAFSNKSLGRSQGTVAGSQERGGESPGGGDGGKGRKEIPLVRAFVCREGVKEGGSVTMKAVLQGGTEYVVRFMGSPLPDDVNARNVAVLGESHGFWGSAGKQRTLAAEQWADLTDEGKKALNIQTVWKGQQARKEVARKQTMNWADDQDRRMEARIVARQSLAQMSARSIQSAIEEEKRRKKARGDDDSDEDDD